MADIRLKTLTVDSGPLFIKSGSVTVLDTTPSFSSITGSLVSNGGLSISSTFDSTSSTSGGSITIGGGMGVSKNVFLGQNLKMENSIGVFEISGLSAPRVLVDSVINKQLSLSPDGVNTRFVLDNEKLILSSTQTSLNSSTGSLVIYGGVSITSTENSSSASAGGSLTLAGGIGIQKDANIGSKVLVGPNESQVVIGSSIEENKTGVFLTYLSEYNAGILSGQTDKNLLLSPFSGNVGIGSTNANFTLDVNGTINSSNYTGENLLVTNNYSENLISSSANLLTSSISNLLVSSASINNMIVSNITSNNLSMNEAIITNFTSSNINSTNLYSINVTATNGTINNLNTINSQHTNITTNTLVASSIRTDVLNISSVGFDQASVNNFTAANLFSGNITSSNINTTNAKFISSTSNNLVYTSSTGDSAIVTNLLNIQGRLISTNNTNTIGNLYTTGGNVGIGTTSPQQKLHVTDTFRISNENGQSFSDISINNNTLTITGKNSGNLTLKSSGDTSKEGVFITKSNDNSILCCLESGNVGIATTDPNYSLDINGSLRANSGDITLGSMYVSNSQLSNITSNTGLFTNTFSSLGGSTIGNVFINGTAGNIGINNTDPSYNLDINGTLRVTSNPNIIGSIITSSRGSLSIGTGTFANSSFRLGMPIGSAIGTSGPDRVYINFTGFDFDITSSVASGGTGSIAYFSRNGRIVTLSGTEESSNIGSGTLVVYGGTSISKNLNIGGNTIIHSTVDSTNSSTGALIVNGGVGITKNLNVLGNTIISGNLIVGGTSTSVETTNTTLKDNIFVLNSGPSGSRDSGFIVNRYQLDNDTGLGDVVSDIYPLIFRLGDQTGLTDTQIKLPSEANSTDNFYTNWWVKITSGFSNDQVRKILSYNGTTKVATISSSWTSQNPANNDYISLYNKSYVGLFFDEINDTFVFGSSINEPGQTNVEFTDMIPIKFSKGINISSEPSSNLSSGSLIMNGGLTIISTEDSTSLTSGGTITTKGGVSIGKTLRTKDLFINNVQFTPNSSDILTTKTFIANNNQSSFSNITGLSFDNDIIGVDIYLTAKISASPNLASNFHIRGVYNGSSWTIVKTYVGDDTGIEFNMTNLGQLQYTTQNYSNVSEILFKFKAFTN